MHRSVNPLYKLSRNKLYNLEATYAKEKLTVFCMLMQKKSRWFRRLHAKLLHTRTKMLSSLTAILLFLVLWALLQPLLPGTHRIHIAYILVPILWRGTLTPFGSATES